MKSRPRRVGLNMKPREGVLSATVVQPEVHEDGELVDLSAPVGQEEMPLEGVSEGVAGESEGGYLQSEALQNLESEEVGEAAGGENEAIVAHLPTFEPLPAVPKEAFDTLADLMKQSEAVTGANPSFIDPDPREFAGVETTRMITFEEAAKIKKQYAIGIDHGSSQDRSVAAVVRLGENGAADELVEMLDLKPMGLLPSGETRAPIRVPEGYWEGVVSAAEADGISVEDWLTNELASRLEDRFFGRR